MSVRGDLGACGARICVPLLVFLALLAPSSDASEPRSRIRSAEPAHIAAAQLPGSSKVAQSGVPTRLVFDAYGRRFDLELESNDRLLRRLSATRRSELPPHDLYRGRVTGLPGSWVRLTRLPDGLYGAIWDGSEFYSIAPAHALSEFMGGTAPPTSDEPLIYRASDVESVGGPATCAVVDPTGGSARPASGLDQYKSLLRELPRQSATTAAAATLELEVAMIADYEFYSAEFDPASALLNRLNVVDGIFSEQVGVAITAAEIAVFDDPSDPFTATDADTLLDQVGRYRVTTPAIAATGLAHLVTGRNLTSHDQFNNIDDSIVGIAYLFGVCEGDIGVSVSERLDPFISALVAAHEFGHNFGAPHDAEPGPCEATPPGFLMDAFLNGSTQFSQCSRQQMAPIVGQSVCIRQRRFIDVEPELLQTAISGYNRNAVRMGFDVTNHGTVTARPVDVTMVIGPSFAIVPVSVEDGTCTASDGTLICRLTEVPAGQSRRIEVDITSERTGRFNGEVTTSTADDVVPANDRGTFELTLLPATDVSITPEAPVSRTLLSGSEFEVSYVVRVDGKQGVSSATVESTPQHGFTVLSASGQGASCTIMAEVVTCQFGAIAVGVTRRVTLRLRAGFAGPQRVLHSLLATGDDTTSNNVAIHDVFVRPLVDLVVRAEPAPTLVRRGETITASFTVLSVGAREATEASVVVETNDELEIVNASAQGATCVRETATRRRCTFAAPIEPDGTRRVDVAVRGIMVGRSLVRAEVFARDNQHVDGPLSTTAISFVEVRELVDVRIEDGFPPPAWDSRPFDLVRRITASGLNAAAGVTYRLRLPEGLVALSAQTSAGSCTVSAASVLCSLGTLEPITGADVSVRLQTSRLGPLAIALEATADNDADATNNSSTAHVFVEPNTDVGLDPPAVLRVTSGRTTRYPITVRSATQPVEGVRVGFLIFGAPQVHIQSVSTALGSCGFVADSAECVIEHMPANSTAVVEVELLGDGQSENSVLVTAFCDRDVDGSNGQLQHTIRLVPPANVLVSGAAADVRTEAGASFAFPRVFVHATSETPDVTLTMRIPASLSIASAIPDKGTCEVGAGTVSCEFGDLIDEIRAVDLNLQATQSGTFTTEIEVAAADDATPDDNSISIDVIVDPARSTSSGGSGGGGGTLDWWSLALAGLGLGLRRSRSAPAVLRRRQVHSG